MENISFSKGKSIQSELPCLDVTKNNQVLRENPKKCSDDEYEKDKYLENIDRNINFEPPSEFLMHKIIQQIESLFSDENILRNKFLLKHMRRNREGYVSLKLVSSLRKVKALSKDWRVVAYSLQKSKKLQVNSEMTKIKRIDPLPLPEVLDATKTVLVFNHLPDSWSSENIKKHLKRLGTIESLMLVKSNIDTMDPTVKKTLALHEGIVFFPFAVVTFQTLEEAANAVYQTSHPASLLKIVPLIQDENYKDTIGGRRCLGSIANFDERREIQTMNRFTEKALLPSACKENGPDNNRWAQRKSRVTKDETGKQKPFMVILRLPRGPNEDFDNTNAKR